VHHVYHMSYVQAIVIGIIQGIGELFPISSLGHTVLLPSWFGGSWGTLVSQESMPESPYLAFVVGLHLATALVLLGFYIREWARIVAGFARTLARRGIETDAERLAWLIIVATIPVGVLGLAFEHQFRVLFAKPLAAAVFLMANGVILLAGETYRRRNVRLAAALAGTPALAGAAPAAGTPAAAAPATSSPTAASPTAASPALPRWRDEAIVPMDAAAEHELGQVGWLSAGLIGASQALALLAGVSREGVAMVGGLFRGLDNENAMRFSFLLSTPVIFAAGILKVPDLTGPLAAGIRGPVLAGALAAAVSSLCAIVFLSRYFKTRTLLPFAIYCLVFGLASVIRFGIF
jgi:undecaprenyl-diphosphatase